MSTDTKIVNVKATIPVRNVTPPIYGEKKNIKMSYNDILKCICRRAIVHEVLPDGSTIRLTTKNFRQDHSKMTINSSAEKVEDSKTESVVEDHIDEEDAMEPEESNLVMEERTYIDGVTRNVMVGSCPECTDPEDVYDNNTTIQTNTTKSNKKHHHKNKK